MASNAISVSWGDHLEFGEGDGALDTPEAIARSVNRWHDELDAGLILWREARSLRKFARWFHTPGVSRRTISERFDPDMDGQRVVIHAG